MEAPLVQLARDELGEEPLDGAEPRGRTEGEHHDEETRHRSDSMRTDSYRPHCLCPPVDVRERCGRLQKQYCQEVQNLLDDTGKHKKWMGSKLRMEGDDRS